MIEQGSLEPDAVFETVDKHFDNLTKDPGRWLETLNPLIELGGLEREVLRGDKPVGLLRWPQISVSIFVHKIPSCFISGIKSSQLR